MEAQVKTQNGMILGREYDGYIVFRGIPYAKPPVGELRWKKPEEMDAWDGIFHADKFGNIAIQDLPEENHPVMGRFRKEFYNDPDFIPEMSEDCLYLNVWAPKTADSEEPLPVAFWIHGGGFSGGYSSEIEFDGEEYCKKGVVLVTVEYRVNVFGFLAHPWLDEENEKGISGNYGIMDQIMALRWVRENIASFGGDPDNITVFGQSAGSMSTQVLVSGKKTENMIAKAILQSGVSCEADIFWTPDLKEAEEFGKIFVECTGAKSIEELRNMSADELNRARRVFDAKMWQCGYGLVMVPNVDGEILEDTVKHIWRDGGMRDIPYMLGAVNDDLGAEKEEIKEKRPGALMEECRKFSLKCEDTYKKPAYLYYFSHDLPGDDWGAFHSSELWYMFGTIDRCWRPMTEEDRKLSEDMVTYWTNFMKFGAPGSVGAKEWKACSKSDPCIKRFE